MAAPPSKTVADLNGKWQMNKSLSDSTDPAMALQGIGWLTRKAVGVATITLDVKQYTGPPSPPNSDTTPVEHIEIQQMSTGGLKGTTEKRCLDHQWREHSDWMFGHVKGQTRWLKPDEITDEFLKKGWLEGEAEATGPEGASHIESYVESLEAGWTARQIWGFQTVDGVRRYCRNIVVTKGAERVQIRLVYDYIS